MGIKSENRAQPLQPGPPCRGFFFGPPSHLCAFPHSQTRLLAYTISLSIGRHYVGWVTIVKLRGINQDMALRHTRAMAHDPARIQGGKWKMQGLRRSGHVHDEAECQMSIAEFMAEQELQQDSYDD